jgi:hypothetical protein
VTKDEADREVARLSGEHPDRQGTSWFAHEVARGDWRVIRINAPPSAQDRPPLRSEELSGSPKPRPETMPPFPPPDWLGGAQG